MSEQTIQFSAKKSRVSGGMADKIKTMIWGHYQADHLTKAQFHVLYAMASMGARQGSLFPSFAYIAQKARCSVRTVAYALKKAEELGILVRFQRRAKRGLRVVRTSNLYKFAVAKVKKLADKPENPWKWVSVSKCKGCTGVYSDKNITGEKHRSREEWLTILDGIGAGLTPKEAGY